MRESLKNVFIMLGISTMVFIEVLFFNWLFNVNWSKVGVAIYFYFVMYFTFINFILAMIVGAFIGMYGSSKKLV